MSSEEKRKYDRENQRRWRARVGNRARQKANRKKRGYRKEREREWRLRRDPATWVKQNLVNCRTRAKEKGIEFSITEKDVDFPLVCPVFGKPFVLGKAIFSNPEGPSIDRIDNTKGYVPGNVAVISIRANFLKKNATLEELQKLVQWMESVS